MASTLCKTPNASDGFYFDLNRAETIKLNKYSKYDIPLHYFFPLAFGRTNVLSRESLRFCDAVGNYFPKALRVTDRLRATLSRSIVNGVATSLNAAVRRLRTAEANQTAFSMIHPIPVPLSQSSALRLRNLAKTYSPLSQLSVNALGARFARALSRSSDSGRSCRSALLQRNRG